MKTVKKTKNNNGFTLIELMVVILLIGILMTIALPSLMSGTSEAKALQKMRVVDTLNACIIGVHARGGWGSNVLSNSNYVSGNDALDMCVAGEIAIVANQKEYFKRLNISGASDMFQITTAATAGSKGVYQLGSTVVSLASTQPAGHLAVLFKDVDDADVCELLIKYEGISTCDLTSADTTGVIQHTVSTAGVSDLTIQRKLAL